MVLLTGGDSLRGPAGKARFGMWLVILYCKCQDLCGKICTSYFFLYSLLGCHYTGIGDIKTQISPIDHRYLACSYISPCAPPPATCKSIRATDTLAAEDSSCQDYVALKTSARSSASMPCRSDRACASCLAWACSAERRKLGMQPNGGPLAGIGEAPVTGESLFQRSPRFHCSSLTKGCFDAA